MNIKDPLTHRFFSLILQYYTFQSRLNPPLQNQRYGGRSTSYMWIFYCAFLTAWRIGILNPCCSRINSGLTGCGVRNESLVLPHSLLVIIWKTVSSSNPLLQKCAPNLFLCFMFFILALYLSFSFSFIKTTPNKNLTISECSKKREKYHNWSFSNSMKNTGYS